MTTDKGKAEGSRRSAKQGQALVEQWRRSGQTAAAFCRRPGTVAVHTLRYWIGREKSSKRINRKEGDFFVVSTPVGSTDRTSLAAPELKDNCPRRSVTHNRSLPNAIIVVLPETSIQGLAQTVQALVQGGTQ